MLSGGSGSRMGSREPKQFHRLKDDRTVLEHAIESILNWNFRIQLVVVANSEHLSRTEKVVASAVRKYSTETSVVSGGQTRHQSTLAGLSALDQNLDAHTPILIHDAARPILTKEELDRLFHRIQVQGGQPSVYSLAAPVTETLVIGDQLPGQVVGPLNRNVVFSIKTPQGATLETFRLLQEHEEQPSFTDLLTWARAAELQGYLVEASPSNIKLTTPSDMKILESYL